MLKDYYFIVSGYLFKTVWWLTFIGSWVYCIISYGYLFGVGLGWLPSFIVATVAAYLSPVILLALIVLGGYLLHLNWDNLGPQVTTIGSMFFGVFIVVIVIAILMGLWERSRFFILSNYSKYGKYFSRIIVGCRLFIALAILTLISNFLIKLPQTLNSMALVGIFSSIIITLLFKKNT